MGILEGLLLAAGCFIAGFLLCMLTNTSIERKIKAAIDSIRGGRD